MNSPKIIIPRTESDKLLAMPTREAEQLFQSYEKQQQLDIINATRNPRKREQLYYLVPDCTELIQESPTVEVLQILDTMLGTGLASALLPCLSNEQFEELVDIAVWRDGKLDQESLNLWLFELSECNRDDLARFLAELDIRLLAALLHQRILLQSEYAAMFIEAEYIDPGSPAIRYLDEQAKTISQAIWEADGEIFLMLLRELFAIDEEGEVDDILAHTLGIAQADRQERVELRDKQTGIDVTEAELTQRVDLNSLTLQDGEEEEQQEENDDDETK